MRFLKTTFLVHGVFLLSILQTFAVDIRIDFSLTDGAAGNNWNSLSAASLTGGTTSLIDHNGGGSTGVTVSGTGWTTDYTGTLNALPSWWDGGTQARDRIYFYDNGPQVGSITLSGLQTSQAYLLEVFSYGDFAERAITANSSYGTNSKTGLLDSAWHGIFDGGEGWLIWDQLMPTAGGTVTISFDSLTANYVPVNALRLSTVPEPSALSLLVVGMGGVMAMRRIRRIAK